MVKQRKDSATIYKEQGREDLAAPELSEAAVIERFLPAQMTEAEIEQLVDDAIAQTGASSMADMGKVMGELKKKHSDEIDFAKAGIFLKQLLDK